MINIKNVTMRNFISVGNVSQAVQLNTEQLVLVLGDNADMGSNGARNGVGKSTMLNAITYALFGSALSEAKVDNLINKTNGKNMLVTLEFEKDNDQYRIERGRKPQLFNIFINGTNVTDNDAQGDSRLTQKELEDVLGMNKIVFSHIIALNTTTIPFLSMKAADQRETIELLFGITKLSEKAEKLKELIKSTKDSIKEEEFRIKGVNDSNALITKNIETTKTKMTTWDANHEDAITKYTDSLNELCELDIDDELNKHATIASISEIATTKKNLEADISALVKELTSITKLRDQAQTTLNKLSTSICPKCDQEIGAHKHEEMLIEYSTAIVGHEENMGPISAAIAELNLALDGIVVPAKPTVFYSKIDDVYKHKGKIDKMAGDLENELAKTNPYLEQQDMLSDSIQVVDYSHMEALKSTQDHQEFLLKLLTNKDSFIRKKIIEQNLFHLNERLRVYLEKIGSPHTVVFHSNLEVYITEYGRDLDFDIISRGERTRVILALSWAFRDVYESMNNKLNLMFIDERLDEGLDQSGVDAAVAMCNLMAREQGRNVFLISHREELVGKVNSILTVRKENGFTTICSSDL